LIALFALAVPLIGYVIGNLGDVCVNLVSGGALRDSWIGNYLQRGQKQHFDQLVEIIRSEANDTEKARAGVALAQTFPHLAEAIAPTAVGNVLLSTASYAVNQYGVRLDAIWPVLNNRLITDDSKEQTLFRQVGESRETLTFLAILCVLLTGIGIASIPVHLALRRYELLLVVLLIFALAAAVYQAALQRARAWDRDTRTILDLYLDRAAEALGLQGLLAQPINQRTELWKDLSRWLTYGAIQLDPPPFKPPKRDLSWYRVPEPPTPEPKPQIQRSPQISVEKFAAAQTRMRATRSADDTYVYGPTVEYLLIAATAPAQPAPACFLIVNDPRLPHTPEQTPGELTPIVGPGVAASTQRITGQRCPSGGVLWLLGELPASQRLTLRFTARSDEISVTVPLAQATITSIEPSWGGRLSVEMNVVKAGAVTICVTASTPFRAPEQISYFMLGMDTPDAKAGELEYGNRHRQCWTMNPSTAGTLTMEFTPPKQETSDDE
jgi:hypothetical protein